MAEMEKVQRRPMECVETWKGGENVIRTLQRRWISGKMIEAERRSIIQEQEDSK